MGTRPAAPSAAAIGSAALRRHPGGAVALRAVRARVRMRVCVCVRGCACVCAGARVCACSAVVVLLSDSEQFGGYGKHEQKRLSAKGTSPL